MALHILLGFIAGWLRMDTHVPCTLVRVLDEYYTNYKSNWIVATIRLVVDDRLSVYFGLGFLYTPAD